jgi:hypothetical protein
MPERTTPGGGRVAQPVLPAPAPPPGTGNGWRPGPRPGRRAGESWSPGWSSWWRWGRRSSAGTRHGVMDHRRLHDRAGLAAGDLRLPSPLDRGGRGLAAGALRRLGADQPRQQRPLRAHARSVDAPPTNHHQAGRWSTGSATDAVAEVGGLRGVDHPNDLQLDTRHQHLKQPTATTEQHRDLMDLQLVQHPGLQRPLRV